MAYATYSDANAYFPANSFQISVSSNPTDTEVAAWIADLEAEINANLAACGYDIVPATGTNDTARLKGKVARKAAAMAWEAHFSKQGATMPAWVERYHAEFTTFMNKLEDCQFTLQDQAVADSGAFSVSTITLNSETYSSTE